MRVEEAPASRESQITMEAVFEPNSVAAYYDGVCSHKERQNVERYLTLDSCYARIMQRLLFGNTDRVGTVPEQLTERVIERYASPTSGDQS